MASPIEILEDWNVALTGDAYGTGDDCCCPMPTCPVPERECERRYFTATCDMDADDTTYPSPDWTPGCYYQFTEPASADELKLYRFYKFEETSHSRGTPDPPEITCTESTYQYRGPSLDQDITLADPITRAEVNEKLRTKIALESWTSYPCTIFAYFFDYWPTALPNPYPDCGDLDEFAWVQGSTIGEFRYRWTIPAAHLGTYFKITWDIIEEPVGWDDDPPTALRSFVERDLTWTWEDPADRTSAWYEVSPSYGNGIRKVANIRFECYRSPWGTKPQVTGDAADITAPTMDMSNPLHSFLQPPIR